MLVAHPLPSRGLPDAMHRWKTRSRCSDALAHGARLSPPSRNIMSMLSKAHSSRTNTSSAGAPGTGVDGTISASSESLRIVISAFPPRSPAIESKVSRRSPRKLLPCLKPAPEWADITSTRILALSIPVRDAAAVRPAGLQ
eukprot:scaffold9266_cov110-Isochrysis_galbana.AAC.10